MHADDKPNSPPGLSWVQELQGALLWPRLLRVPALAARPQRVMLSLFLLVLVSVIGGIRMPGRGDTPAFAEAVLAAKLEAMGQLGRAVLGADAASATDAFAQLVSGVPTLAFTDYTLETFLLGIPILLVLAVFAGAVCRSVACEFSQELTLPWTRQLGFAAARWKTLVGVVALPAALIGLIALILAIAGFVFFNIVPGLELIGGLLFFIALLLSLAAVAVLVLTTIAWPMLVPSAVCEGTDAIDAAGRVLAYAIARPLRLLVYLAIAGLVCAVVGMIAIAVANGTAGFAESAVTAWTSDRGFAEVRGQFPVPILDEEGNAESIGALAGASSWLVGFWGGCLRVLAASYILSMVLTAGTLVYLFMRQACDGQHYAELWTPGQIERAFEAAMSDAGSQADATD